MHFTKMLAIGAAIVAGSQAANLFAQVVADPNVAGPARRAIAGAADAAGNPAVEQRIQAREERRDAVRAANGNPNAAARNEARAANPEAWRMQRHNNQWWYYTPNNTWMYHNNNAWTNYNPQTYVAPNYYDTRRGFMGGRYTTGYRGVYGPPATPYSNGTPAGNYGSTLGADIGASANGGAGAQTGARLGAAIGNAIGAGEAAVQGQGPNPNVAPQVVQPVPVPQPVR